MFTEYQKALIRGLNHLVYGPKSTIIGKPWGDSTDIPGPVEDLIRLKDPDDTDVMFGNGYELIITRISDIPYIAVRRIFYNGEYGDKDGVIEGFIRFFPDCAKREGLCYSYLDTLDKLDALINEKDWG